MAGTVEAGRQNVDQEPANELVRGQAHDLHSIATLDAVVFSPEGHGVGVRADEAVVGRGEVYCYNLKRLGQWTVEKTVPGDDFRKMTRLTDCHCTTAAEEMVLKKSNLAKL